MFCAFILTVISSTLTLSYKLWHPTQIAFRLSVIAFLKRGVKTKLLKIRLPRYIFARKHELGNLGSDYKMVDFIVSVKNCTAEDHSSESLFKILFFDCALLLIIITIVFSCIFMIF